MPEAQLLHCRPQTVPMITHRTGNYDCLYLILEFLFLGFCFNFASWAQSSSGSPPIRWQAQYTQIYSDDIETIAPTLTPAFSLGAAGSLTSNSAEVIAGNESIKGSYSGSASFTPYLQTKQSALPLNPNHQYTVTFQYKILTAPAAYFEVLFYSPTGAAQNNFLHSVTINGPAGTAGTATLTDTLANYSDYQVLWTIASTGVISIDNIQIIDGATGKVIASESAEGSAP